MKQFFEFIPLIIFFAVYKMQDIYAATLALIIAAAVLLAISYLKNKKVEKMHLISFVLILVFGGLTLVLRDDDFIKWKPTVINWLFGVVLLLSQFPFGSPLIKKMLGKEMQLPDAVWGKVNVAWALFFIGCGTLNLYIAFNYSEDVWVNFKVFGLLGLTLLFTVATVIYLYKHLPKEQQDSLSQKKD
ncbi:septation protein A [Agarivorans sp. MS3-6]|uniref:septation protein A n=1 Tax=Agarivorans sp. TSD2052 TaxID=2937286 RepID=UPI00200CAF03|nr:septation protein A [Agarivorans sp. TSD2052]UPW17120.1 septation protein A [Agarivorans sp. TSD2052]